MATNRLHAAGKLCDFVKAFGFVNHEKCLLAELHLYVILAVSEDLFSSCLTNSRQKVEVK